MNKQKINFRTSTLSIFLLGIILLGFFLPTVLSATSYQLTLAKGTKEFTIEQFDESNWKSTVDPLLNPSDWFEGEANVTNAKSKLTLKGWTTNTWHLFDCLISIILPQYYTIEEIFAIQEFLKSQGYNETTINANYTTSYDIWYGIRSVWNFTVNMFEENPSYIDGIIIFQNPLLYKTLLDDYHHLADILNDNIAIPFTFPNITTDDFLWQFALNGFTIADPQSEYLADVINVLECENASVSGPSLIFKRYGLTNYTVEISYDVKGMINSFTVKDATGTIIYLINSSNSEWFFYLILIVTSSSIIGLVIFIIIRTRKLKR